jgi:hypothetical protein
MANVYLQNKHGQTKVLTEPSGGRNPWAAFFLSLFFGTLGLFYTNWVLGLISAIVFGGIGFSLGASGNLDGIRVLAFIVTVGSIIVNVSIANENKKRYDDFIYEVSNYNNSDRW